MEDIRGVFKQSAANLLAACDMAYAARVEEVIDLLVRTFRGGGKLLVFGNGGSAADAMHIAGELEGRFNLDRPGLPAVALGCNTALATAWSNDHTFETIFAREIEALGKPGDVAWGISTSGNSRNVVLGCERARRNGLKTIGLTGAGGGKLGAHCDILLAPEVGETPRVQEVHLVTYHAICSGVEVALFGRQAHEPEARRPGLPLQATQRK